MIKFIFFLIPFIFTTEPQAQHVLEPGSTYRLNAAQYPDHVVVCTSKESIRKYIFNEESSSGKKIKIHNRPKSNEELDNITKQGGCIRIISQSQAEIIEGEKGFYKALFYNFALQPFWGYVTYFGGKVK